MYRMVTVSLSFFLFYDNFFHCMDSDEENISESEL